MARLAILTFVAVLCETTSMVLSRWQTAARVARRGRASACADAGLASTKTDAEKVLEAPAADRFVDDGRWDAVHGARDLTNSRALENRQSKN